MIYGFREAVFTPCLLWKPKTKQSRGGRSPSSWSGRQYQVDAQGFIFSDVGRWWELSLRRRRMWWVCVRYKECASMHTCRCVCVCVNSWVGVCRAHHGFVNGQTGSWKGDWVVSGPGTLRWVSSGHTLLLRALTMGHCLVPPVFSFLPRPHAAESTWPGPWPLCAICPRTT